HPLTRDCFHPVSNWRPFACEANVITTTLWKQITLALDPFGTEEILESGLNLKFVSRQTTRDCFHPVSNWGPFACKANVITTTLWKQITLSLDPFGTGEILESGSSEGLVPRQTTALNKRLFQPSFERIACEANMITTTLWKQITLALAPFGAEEILESGSSEGLVPRQTTSLNKRLFPPSFELGTFRVLGERDNHYTMET